MKKRAYLLVYITAILLLNDCNSAPPEYDKQEKIRVNSIGYLTDGPKHATLLTKSSSYTIINCKNGKVILNSKAHGPIYQEDVNDSVYIADFSNLNVPGTYCLQTIDGYRSIPFAISDDVYDSAFYTTMRGFYLWRCGTAVEGIYHGDTFRQKICHTTDGNLKYTEFGDKHKDGTGGWHDAGDHGKYVVNAGITTGMLFLAWENFKPQLESIDLDIPNTAESYPDFLKELKWETDWLLKMQYPDNSGRISHKLTRLKFSGFIMPSDDTVQRYFTEWGSNATANFVGIMAKAYRSFKPYDSAYAQTCLKAAEKSFNYLLTNPEYVKWDQKEFRTGGYQTKDEGARLWATAEMWEATGNPDYLKILEERITKSPSKFDYNWDWEDPRNLGFFTYLLSEQKGKNSEIYKAITDAMISVADSIVESTQTDIYGRPLAKYYWGCNGTVARLASNLFVAYYITGKEKYKEASREIISHIFGRNYYGRSYVTGLGYNPPMHPHDRRSGADSIVAPWPGYLVGGGHTATDWVDEERNYSKNEIAINWQAGLVYALAWCLD